MTKDLTNDDFREIIMTPARDGHLSQSHNSKQQQQPKQLSEAAKQKSERKNYFKMLHLNKLKNQKRNPKSGTNQSAGEVDQNNFEDDQDDADITLAELQLKYRDRAKERREGIQKDELESSTTRMTDKNHNKHFMPTDNTNMFHENKLTTVEESKYLGGDIEHTHLVKGLDYSLLKKVRSEIDGENKEATGENKQVAVANSLPEQSIFARKIMEAFLKKEDKTKTKVESGSFKFMQSKQCFSYDLNQEFAEFLIPTAIISSSSVEDDTIYFSDIVDPNEAIKRISFATSYLQSFKSAKDRNASSASTSKRQSSKMNHDIYDDIGTDYIPSYDKSATSSKNNNISKESSKRISSKSYFDDIKPAEINSQLQKKRAIGSDSQAKPVSKLSKLKLQSETTGYDECYPDFVEIPIEVKDKKGANTVNNAEKNKAKKNSTSHFNNEWNKIQKIIDK